MGQASDLVLPLSIYNYRLSLSYDGSLFEGWQIQTSSQRTVQGELHKALSKIVKSEKLKSLGSGRTDSGVHALGQIVKIQIPLLIEPLSLVRALNSHLPEEIRIKDCQESNDEFHPVRDALWKTYEYIIFDGPTMPPFFRNLVTHVPRKIDWQKVEKALNVFFGEHDFINFSTKGTEVKTTRRIIFDASLKKEPMASFIDSTQPGTLYRISVTGNGFLKQMVRLIVGAVLAAGQDKVSPEEIMKHFDVQTDQKIGPVAPPNGLYLVHVEYDKPFNGIN